MSVLSFKATTRRVPFIKVSCCPFYSKATTVGQTMRVVTKTPLPPTTSGLQWTSSYLSARPKINHYGHTHSSTKLTVSWFQQHWITSHSKQTQQDDDVGIESKASATTVPIRYNNFIDRLPASWAPYAFLTRIDKPIGTWLLYWPCAWSITMAATQQHAPLSATIGMLTLFGIGAITMRGAGCTINDLWDRDIDDKVERTKIRPIASGAVTPRQAITFLAGQLTVGLAVLTQLNNYSILLGASSLSLVVTYPLMKRITYWPQVVLGLAFNWGALLGWSAMTGGLDLSVAAPLYAGGVAWTLVYDTIYAHQDKTDDIKIGVKSTALRFGERTPQWLSGFATTFVSMTALAGYMNDQGAPFYLISVLGTAAHLAWQLRTVNYNSPADCWSKFKSNTWTGGILWSGLVVDGLVKASPLMS